MRIGQSLKLDYVIYFDFNSLSLSLKIIRASDFDSPIGETAVGD
jgi:hypothetical protein